MMIFINAEVDVINDRDESKFTVSRIQAFNPKVIFICNKSAEDFGGCQLLTFHLNFDTQQWKLLVIIK